MQRRIFKIIISIVVLTVTSYLCYMVVSGVQEKKEITDRIQIIPEFSFTTLDTTVFSKIDLKRNVPTIFLYFNSECDFCQYEAQSICDNIGKFTNIQLIFISTEPIEKIKSFSEAHRLNKQSNITFLHDKSKSFFKQFGATIIPYILVYDKNQSLIKTLKGQLSANSILKTLNK